MKGYSKATLLTAFAIFLFSHLSAQTVEVLVSNRSVSAVALYDENGNYINDIVTPGSGGLSATEDILFHPDGSILVTGNNNATIKRYDGITGGYLGDFTSGYTLSLPSKISIGPDSLIYVTQWSQTQNKIARFDLQGNYVDEFTSGVPNGLGHVWDEDKNFYIAAYGNGANGTVLKFDSLGNSLGVFINTTILQGPTSIWFDTSGDMLVEDWTVGKVLRFDSTGQYVSDFVIGLTNPEGMAFLPNGNMLIGDWGIDGVHLVDPSGTLQGYFCTGNGLTDVNSVKVRPATAASVLNVKKRGLELSPNTGRFFHVKVPGDISKNASIRILNTQGQVITHLRVSSEIIWDAGDHPEGLYFIQLSDGETRVTGKVLVSAN